MRWEWNCWMPFSTPKDFADFQSWASLNCSHRPWEITSGVPAWWPTTSGEEYCNSQRFRLTIEPGLSYMMIMLMVRTMMISIIYDWNYSKKFGPGWNAVVGEAYSFEISYTKWEALNYLWIIQCQFGFFKNSRKSFIILSDYKHIPAYNNWTVFLIVRGTLMYMYFGGHLGICVWKANWGKFALLNMFI